MPDGENALVTALNSIAALGTERDLEQIGALLDRLEAARLRVLVAGEAKRGKSTLINALLGRDVLPSRTRPGPPLRASLRQPRPGIRFQGSGAGEEDGSQAGRGRARPARSVHSGVLEREESEFGTRDVAMLRPDVGQPA
jgi:GTPase SAR1 family protein